VLISQPEAKFLTNDVISHRIEFRNSECRAPKHEIHITIYVPLFRSRALTSDKMRSRFIQFYFEEIPEYTLILKDIFCD
jgi:hypothetical protein